MQILRKAVASVILVVTLLCASSAVNAEDNLWTDESIIYHDRVIQVHAMIDDQFPTPLKQIEIVKKQIPDTTIETALRAHFTLIDGFDFTKPWFDGYLYRAGGASPRIPLCDFRVFNEHEFGEFFPIQDETLAQVNEQCRAFLEDVGYIATPSVGYIYYTPEFARPEGGETYIFALVPYQLAGLSTEYKCNIVTRDRIELSDVTGLSILEYPWAAFTLTTDCRLIRLDMSCYEIGWEKSWPGNPISWQEAIVEIVEDMLTSHPVPIKTEEAAAAAYLEAESYEQFFFDHYTATVVRVLPMWLPNWGNVCIPGWCVRMEFHDKATGEFLAAIDRCVVATTGEVVYGMK